MKAAFDAARQEVEKRGLKKKGYISIFTRGFVCGYEAGYAKGQWEGYKREKGSREGEEI